jgi:hypothetical protein
MKQRAVISFADWLKEPNISHVDETVTTRCQQSKALCMSVYLSLAFTALDLSPYPMEKVFWGLYIPQS